MAMLGDLLEDAMGSLLPPAAVAMFRVMLDLTGGSWMIASPNFDPGELPGPPRLETTKRLVG